MSGPNIDGLLVRVFVNLFRVSAWFQWLVIIFVALELMLAGAEVALWARRHWVVSVPIAVTSVGLIWGFVGLRRDPAAPPMRPLRHLGLTAAWTAAAIVALVAVVYILRLAIRHPAYSAPFAVLMAIFAIMLTVTMLREPEEPPAEPETPPTRRPRRKRSKGGVAKRTARPTPDQA